MVYATDADRFNFNTAEDAWNFAKNMVKLGKTVTDYGLDEKRLIGGSYIDGYYIDIKR